MKHILAGKTVKPLQNMMARILLEHLTSRRLACACVFLALVLSTVPAGALDNWERAKKQEKDNTHLVIKRSPYPTVTGKSGPIQMPFFEQCQGGTCWANCGKMLQKGLYPGDLGATSTYEIFQFMWHLNIPLGLFPCFITGISDV